MWGTELKEEGQHNALKSDVTTSTRDPHINNASSLKTNMLLSVQCKKGHMPRTINSVYPETDELLKDNHLNGSSSGQMSDKPLLGKSKNVLGLIGKGMLARQGDVKPNIDWGCDLTSGSATSGLVLSAQGNDNRGIWSVESSSFLDNDGPNVGGKLTSGASPAQHRRRKRKMEMVVMSDPSEDVYTIVSLDSQTSDERSKGEQMNGSSQPKIPNVRLLDHFGSLSKPDTKPEKSCSALPPNATDERRQRNRDMVFRPAISDQNNGNETVADFDSEHSGSTSDNYDDDANDFNWDPQREFIKFLWEDLDQDQKKNAEVSANIVKKQMASVEMGTDYSNDLCMNLIKKTQNGQSDHTDQISIRPQGKDVETSQVVRSRQYYKEHVEGIQKFIYGEPEGTEETSIGRELTVRKEQLLESGRSNAEPLFFPCTNCNIICQERNQLHRHMRQHGEAAGQAQTLPLICKECGWAFHNPSALLQHRSIHIERRRRLIEEMKELNDLKDVGRSTRLQHALCLYETNNPNTRAPHTKTSEKGKRYCSCVKCDLKAVTEFEHKSRFLTTHNVHKTQTLNEEPDALHAICPKGVEAESNTVYLNTVCLTGAQNQQAVSNEQASHDYRSYTQEGGTGSVAGCSDGNESRNKTTLRKKCENSEKESEHDSPQTSKEMFQPTLMDIMVSSSQRQEDIKEIINTNEKHVNIKQPVINNCPSKGTMSSLLHGMKVQDGPLPAHQHSLQKEELNNLSVRDSHNSVTENLKSNCNVGEVLPDLYPSNNQVRLKDISSLFEEDCDRKVVMNPQKILDEGNIEGGDVCVLRSEVLLKTKPPSESDLGRKSRSYCPALFETAVSFSTHTRTHTQRVGVSVNAQQVISSPQVTSRDKYPHTQGKMTSVPRGAKEASEQKERVHTDSQAESNCPLCGVRFETKTGLSNHVRGHLKRLGKAYSTATLRSPLDILKQLMSNREEFHKTLRAFHKRQIASKTSSRKDPFFISVASITDNAQSSCEGLPEEGAKNKWFESTDSERYSPSSDLIGMLKKRKSHEVKNPSQTTRKAALPFPLPQTDSLSEKSNFNRKVCVHCNATFHSGVSLSNHLRAYARRERAALLDGTTYDCKQKKQRSRSGLKKKTFPLPYTTEEMYRLTCRFCDLVFQGPLSVQEDWIKHLQRHIINTSVAHTGACMVEVTSLPIDPIGETRTEASLFLTQVCT
ncbi:zinc finger protein 644a isoform X3 [Clupea harengus]|uniref:Zinc finger protein 644a isoform X3 n=1 Tax=Clupea harengus TaxID=7950 RepID=A0A6P8EUK8_CLUHA|nr:zinc finger protein 644a isoform X3 [Clupea harengus]